MNTFRRPQLVATTTLAAGIVVSLAGNLKAIGLENAAPQAGAYVSAVVWPVLLFLSIELMIHTPWLRNKRDAMTKGATLILVAFVSLWESYWHLQGVLESFGYDVVGSHLGPLAVDAAMALATLALNRVGQAKRLADTPAPIVATVTAPVEPQVAAEHMTPGLESTPLADEATSWLEGLTERLGGQGALEAATTPAHELTAGKLTGASNEVNPEAVPETAAMAFKAWTTADPTERPRVGQVYELVAADHGVSTRTARRWMTSWSKTNA